MHSPLNCAINKKHFIWALNKARERERERGVKSERDRGPNWCLFHWKIFVSVV